MNLIRFALPIVAAAALLSACDKQSNQELLASAHAYLAQGDTAAAVIQLRTLLARKSNASEARFLLGRIAYEAGQMPAAEDQLRLALQQGYPEEEVVPLLAKAMAAMNRAAALVQEFGALEFADREATATLKLQIAAAHMFERKFAEAAKDVERALELVPGHADALAVRARLAAIAGQPAAAQQQLDELLARHPQNALALALKADLLLGAKPQQLDAVIEAHRAALSVRPNLVQSHAAILALLIARGAIDDAAAQWAELKRALPVHPQTRFFEGVLALHRGDAEKARAISQSMLTSSPADVRLLLLAAQAELQLNGTAQAEALLAKAIGFAPTADLPRKLLAEVHLRAGRPEDALATLDMLVLPRYEDASSLTLAGRAHVMAGDFAAANASFARALKLKPDDASVRTAAAISQLARSPDRAFAELQSIARAASEPAADLAMISARFARREFDLALQAIESLAGKMRNAPLPDDLRGRVMLAKGDAAAARRHFEAALARQPGYFPALASLVSLDLAEGAPARAVSRLEVVRQREPHNAQVRLALARLNRQQGSPASAVLALLEEAVKAKPADAAARVALVEHHVAAKKPDLALSAALSAAADVPDSLVVLDVLGRIYLSRSDHELAIATFAKMMKQWPRSALPYIRLAEVHLARRDAAAAADHARLALKEAPSSLAAQRLAATAALRQRRPGEALAIARKVQEQRPREATGYMLEGEIEMHLRHYGAAAAAYRNAVARSPSTDAAKRLYLALIGTGNAAEAERWAAQWRKEHPDDLAFVVHMADVAVGRGALDVAESRYREVLARQPANALAMSNVAYTMVKQNKPGALPLAERAASLAPNNAAVLDTLAAAYEAENRMRTAIEWQTKAVELAPDVAAFRLTLARMHIRANDRDKAVVELDRLAQLGKSFPGYGEVARLRKKLGP